MQYHCVFLDIVLRCLLMDTLFPLLPLCCLQICVLCAVRMDWHARCVDCFEHVWRKYFKYQRMFTEQI